MVRAGKGKMKPMLRGLLFMLLLLYPLSVSAGVLAGSGLEGSRHDFSDRGPNGAVGLCTFCHTPHKAGETRLLWNHSLSTNGSWSWDDATTTIGGTPLPELTNAWSGPTKYCLSCHDGSVAVGDVNWWDGGDPGILWNVKHDSGYLNVGGGGSMNGNHPVAFPYPHNQQKNTYNGVTTGDNVVLDEFRQQPELLNIRLFNDDGSGNVTAGVVAGKTGIECSSCHDPHNKKSVATYFLRGKLRWSVGGGNDYICTKCHTKD